MLIVSDETRDELARILEEVAKDGMPHPRNLDAALDAILCTLDNPRRFFLDQDNDCHWYLVEAGKREEWRAWNDLPEDDERSWDAPEFAQRIDGAESITFTNPVEEA